jgi:hypothetical protein
MAMDRATAFKTLRLDQSADGQMVENAYWTLVRQAQLRAAGQPEAAGDIEALNEAYRILSPDGRQYAPKVSAPRQVTSGVAIIDWFADWVNEEALRTRRRWHNRNPEIALIGGAALVLMFLAIGAGASLWGVFLSSLIIVGAIWSPWRKPEEPAAHIEPEQLAQPKPKRRAKAS